MTTSSRQHFELRRILGPWIRDLRTGTVRRELAGGGAKVELPADARGSSWTKAEKNELDRSLRNAGFVLIDLPGGCTIEEG